MKPEIIDLDGDDPGESFETATPKEVEPKKVRQGRNGTVATPSAEAEEHVIACCFLDEGHTLAVARESIGPDSFLTPQLAYVFKSLCRMQDANIPIALDALLTEEPKTAAQVGMPYLLQLTDPNKYPTTARANYYIQKVRTDQVRRTLERGAKDLLEKLGNNHDIDSLLELASSLAPEAGIETEEKPRPITSYAYPSDDDSNVLLGNDDYLGRGGGMLFVSHAGAGKSSWIMDACMMWALGRPWMGIKCGRPLRSLIIQAEDSDRYIGKIFTSFAFANSLGTEAIEQIEKNCIIVRVKGVTGQAFERLLSKLTKKHQPDLVVINPIYLYAEGDITRSEFAQPFLVGLDRVNKEEKFAYILIHHTGKPAARDKQGNRASLDDWETAYMGFGSSYFANWPRCTALLEPVAGTPGRFQIKLGKGGLNAGVTKQVPAGAGTRDEPVTRIQIQHSTKKMPVDGRDRPVYYWELDDSPPPEPVKNPMGAGRKRKYHTQDYECILPRGPENGKGFNVLYREAKQISNAMSVGTWDMLVLEMMELGLLVKDVTNPRQPKYYRPVEKQA